jgi:hypothetical protein
MTDDEKKYIQWLIGEEEFHYCFTELNFDEINDPEFHRLLKLYIEVAKQLENYIAVEGSD